ncbi:MAG: hypothetical protein KME09_04605 [Pleurocapsa minor HA4230-MV1]|jgi:hypothetical protein|nr:hypothetical protein [Pleurocapsa minor HA4230-MV1]
MSISSTQNIKKYTFTVEVNINELTTTYLEALETDEPDSLKSMIEHECHWIEASGLYVRKIAEVTPVLPDSSLNNHQFRFQILQACSKNFLTESLPDDWYELTDQQQDNFLCGCAWQPLEHLSAQELWQLIESSADTFSAFLLNH